MSHKGWAARPGLLWLLGRGIRVIWRMLPLLPLFHSELAASDTSHLLLWNNGQLPHQISQPSLPSLSSLESSSFSSAPLLSLWRPFLTFSWNIEWITDSLKSRSQFFNVYWVQLSWASNLMIWGPSESEQGPLSKPIRCDADASGGVWNGAFGSYCRFLSTSSRLSCTCQHKPRYHRGLDGSTCLLAF